MAKIKTIKIKLAETIYDIVVKCNTNGKFIFEAPASLIAIVKPLDDINRCYFDTLKELEDKVYKAINEYKKAVIKRKLVIKVDFGASGKFVKDESGFLLPQFSNYGGKFCINDVFTDGNNLIKFGYKILIEESMNDCVTYYSTIKYDNDIPIYEDRRVGNYLASHYKVHLGKDEKVLPYTEEIINNLNSIEQQLKNAALFLSQLLSNDEIEQILTSGNLKLLSNKED